MVRRVSRDGWDPDQYSRFAAERAQPFWDLVALIRPSGEPGGGFGRCADLGCGTGELTAAVTDRLDIAEMLGVDSSDAMLAKARADVGDRDHRLRFARGDIAQWTGRADHDLVLSNASLHWVPDHPAVLQRWWAAVAPGGQLAVQVPANADHPAAVIAGQVASTEPFLTAFNLMPPPDPVAQNVLAPEQYAVVLDDLGATEQSVRLQVYPHRLPSTADVVEWMRGTSLTRFLRILPTDVGEQFLATCRERILAELGEHVPFFFPFKRILVWARKGS
jgi:trans-aconitate 2-methyltransferase